VNLPRTEMGWQVYPPFLYYALERIHRLYQPGPIYMTENGCAMDDRPDAEGQVHDLWRKEYIRTHLGQLLDLREEGVPVQGYFAWSLLDNYEWQYGYSKRFGLVRVDYQTQQRTLKTSARWYARCARDRVLHSLHGAF
jgi:beta-glucosidase